MWQEGGHDGRQATAIFADAMRWLWKGWPVPVKAGWSANDMLKDIIDTTDQWHKVTDDMQLHPMSNALVLPDGNQYILQSGTISFKTKSKTIVADKDANFGNAFAISPDKAQLVVSGKHSHWLYDYIIQPDGTLTNKQTLYWLHNPGNNDTSEVNSIAFDTNGNLYAATDMGVQVCDQNGRARAILSLPGGAATSLWFAGQKMDTLFVSCKEKLYKRKLKVTGITSAQKAVVPKPQGGG